MVLEPWSLVQTLPILDEERERQLEQPGVLKEDLKEESLPFQ